MFRETAEKCGILDQYAKKHFGGLTLFFFTMLAGLSANEKHATGWTFVWKHSMAVERRTTSTARVLLVHQSDECTKCVSQAKCHTLALVLYGLDEISATTV